MMMASAGGASSPFLRAYYHLVAAEAGSSQARRLMVEAPDLALSPARKLQSDPLFGIITAVISMPPNRPTIGWLATPNRSPSDATFPRPMEANRA
jgi:hypothetical protein